MDKNASMESENTVDFPLKHKLSKYLNKENDLCPLCGKERKTKIHQFLYCEVVRIAWFGTQWDPRFDHIQVVRIPWQ